MKTGKYLIILFSILCLQFKVAFNEKIFKLSNMECKSLNESYAKIAQCKLKAIRLGHTEGTVEIVVMRKPITNATVQAKVWKRGVKIGNALLETFVDCCAFLRNKRRNIFAQLLYEFLGFENWSNMNHTCPFHHDLLLKQYPVDGKKLGKLLPLPVGHYTLNTIWSTYNVPRILVDVHFQLNEI